MTPTSKWLPIDDIYYGIEWFDKHKHIAQMAEIDKVSVPLFFSKMYSLFFCFL